MRDAKKTNDFDPEMRDWSLIRNREELGRRKRRKKKKQTKGRLMLQDQEREENGGERQIYIPKASTRFTAGDGAGSVP